MLSRAPIGSGLGHSRGVLARVLVVIIGVGTGVGALGCRTIGIATPERPSVRVVDVALKFPKADRGELELDLEVETPDGQEARVEQVSWELWLQRRWFASGAQLVFEVIPRGASAKLQLRAPFAYRHLTTRAGEVSVQTGVRGEVRAKTLGGELLVLPFELRTRLEVENAPNL